MRMRFLIDVDVEASSPDEYEAAEKLRAEWQQLYTRFEGEFRDYVHIDDSLACDVGRILGTAIRDAIELTRRARAISASGGRP